MTPLEAARKLAESGFTPWAADDDPSVVCEMCNRVVETTSEPNQWIGHAPDCPWLSMSKIAAALEAAERVVEHHPESTERIVMVPYSEYMGLLAALRGDSISSIGHQPSPSGAGYFNRVGFVEKTSEVDFPAVDLDGRLPPLDC